MPKVGGVELGYDENAHGVQALAPGESTAVATSAGSTATALPTSSKVVEVSVTTGTWVKFGTGATTASNTDSLYMSAGSAAVWRVPAGATHLAHIQDTSAGRISITRLT